MTPERGYDVAKHLPEEHFGNELKVTVVYMEKITGCLDGQVLGLRTLKDSKPHLCESSNALEELKYLEKLNTSANIKSCLFHIKPEIKFSKRM